MNIESLTPDQRRKLYFAVVKRRDFFGKIRDRMKQQNWAEEDDLFKLVMAAWNAAHQVVRALAEKKVEEPVEIPQWRKAMS